MEFSKYYNWDKEGKKADMEKEAVTPKMPVDREAASQDSGEEKVGFADIMKPKDLKEGDIFAVYMEILEFGGEVLEKAEKDLPISGSELEERVRKLVDYVIAGEKLFLEFVFTDTEKENEARHIVNTMILSLEVGLELGYNKSRLFELALGALLHDIGIIKYSALTRAEKRLSMAEYEEIKKHPIHGLEVLKRIENISQEVIRVVHEHHERLDGSGYPRGIDNGHIHENAMIVGIVDMFEAMTHHRPYREKMSAHDALKELINMGASVVEPRYVEALVHRIGLYPIGSWVELSTGEIAKVIEINKKFPLRPIVSVVYAKGGNKLDEVKQIDISKQPVIFIRKVLQDKELIEKISHKT
jgi:HD-GYP domain-containing protein (c-di-GMP phosphodiesterase class II)